MMNRHVLLTAAIVLPLGLAGGIAASYLWLCEYMMCHDAATADHDDEGAHEGHDHAAEDGEHEHGSVALSDEMVRQLGVEVAVVEGGKLEQTLRLPAEIVLNADRVAHIVPRVAGMVRDVRKNLGDRVEAGELMAMLESRELAEAKAADLAAEARLRLADSSFKRVEELLQKKIAPEQEYYEARQKLEEAQIAHRETVARLHALGLDHDAVTKVSSEREADFSLYEIRAPFAGTVIDKHISLGEVHDSGSDVFVLTDLSTVWVDIALYAQDISRVRTGAGVRVASSAGAGEPKAAEGQLFYISPIVRETTRTGLARAAIPNMDGLWRPGSFVTAEVIVGEDTVPVLVPNEAIQRIGDETVVFVAESGAFHERLIVPGRRSESHTEILSGLDVGERCVTRGAFILKAELAKGTGGHEH